MNPIETEVYIDIRLSCFVFVKLSIRAEPLLKTLSEVGKTTLNIHIASNSTKRFPAQVLPTLEMTLANIRLSEIRVRAISERKTSAFP